MCDQAFTHTRSLSGSDLELQSLSPNCPPNRASSKQSRRTHLLTTGGCKPVIETYANNVVADGHPGPCIDRGRRHVEIARILQADVKVFELRRPIARDGRFDKRRVSGGLGNDSWCGLYQPNMVAIVKHTSGKRATQWRIGFVRTQRASGLGDGFPEAQFWPDRLQMVHAPAPAPHLLVLRVNQRAVGKDRRLNVSDLRRFWAQCKLAHRQEVLPSSRHTSNGKFKASRGRASLSWRCTSSWGLLHEQSHCVRGMWLHIGRVFCIGPQP